MAPTANLRRSFDAPVLSLDLELTRSADRLMTSRLESVKVLILFIRGDI